jgi:TetR/AcrR family transcriptional repressor of lmrAB and yxaGH operons
MTELTKGERTKKKLVEATAALLRKQGYHATGLSAIIEESGAPRGSLYFYFPEGKDQLAVAAIEEAGAVWRTRVQQAVVGAKDIGTAIDAVIDVLAEDLVKSKWENGCPCAPLALEAASRPVQAAVKAHYDGMLKMIAAGMEGFGVPAALAAQAATVALAAIEGALLLARVERSKRPLQTVGAALKMMLSR